MKIVYSDHAKKRMKQRGITALEIESILSAPTYTKKTFEGKKEAVGMIRNKTIKIIFYEEESYIKIITLLND